MNGLLGTGSVPVILASVWFAAGCSGGDTGGTPNAGEGSVSAGTGSLAASPSASADSVVTYSQVIQPILQADCSPCHAGQGRGGHNAATSYADAVRVAERITSDITSGSMPASGSGNVGCRRAAPGSPGCVSVADLALIKEWVAAGKPQ